MPRRRALHAGETDAQVVSIRWHVCVCVCVFRKLTNLDTFCRQGPRCTLGICARLVFLLLVELDIVCACHVAIGYVLFRPSLADSGQVSLAKSVWPSQFGQVSLAKSGRFRPGKSGQVLLLQFRCHGQVLTAHKVERRKRPAHTTCNEAQRNWTTRTSNGPWGNGLWGNGLGSSAQRTRVKCATEWCATEWCTWIRK